MADYAADDFEKIAARLDELQRDKRFLEYAHTVAYESGIIGRATALAEQAAARRACGPT